MNKLKNWVKEKREPAPEGPGRPSAAPSRAAVPGEASSSGPGDEDGGDGGGSQLNPFSNGVPDLSEVLDEEELFRVQMAIALEQSAKEAGVDPSSLPPPPSESEGVHADGQAMACRYWVSGTVAFEEGIVDGFYDIWGDLPSGGADGRLPSVAELRNIRPPTRMPAAGSTLLEVLLVDHGGDNELVALEQQARSRVPDHIENEARAFVLAEIVAGHMGGSIEGGDAVLAASWMESTYEMQRAAGTVVAKLGEMAYGMSRHRALLFKVLADHILLPCSLVRGGVLGEDNDLRATAVISGGRGRTFVVDLVENVGSLLEVETGAIPGPAGESVGGGATAGAGAPSAPAAPLLSSMGPTPPSSQDMDPRVLQLMAEHEQLDSEEVLAAAVLVNNDMDLAKVMCAVMETTGTAASDAFGWCESHGWLVDQVVAAYFDAKQSSGAHMRPMTPDVNWGAPSPARGGLPTETMFGMGAGGGGPGGGWWRDDTPEGLQSQAQAQEQAQRLRAIREEEERIQADAARREEQRRQEQARREADLEAQRHRLTEEQMAEEARNIMRESKRRAQEEYRRLQEEKRRVEEQLAREGELPAWQQRDREFGGSGSFRRSNSSASVGSETAATGSGRPPVGRSGSSRGVDVDGGPRGRSGHDARPRPSGSGTATPTTTPGTPTSTSGSYEFGQGWFGAAPAQQASSNCGNCGTLALVRPDNGLCGSCHRLKLEARARRRAAGGASRSSSRRGSAAGASDAGTPKAGAGGGEGGAADLEREAAQAIFREVRERSRQAVVAGAGPAATEPEVNKRVQEIRERVRSEEQLEHVKAKLRADIASDITRRTHGHDLPSVMRMFGIEVQGSPHPTAAQVRKAYHQAAKLFHPDRQKGKQIRDQVHCEEIFKCIQKKVDEFHG